jgi:hypothetical protein
LVVWQVSTLTSWPKLSETHVLIQLDTKGEAQLVKVFCRVFPLESPV